MACILKNYSIIRLHYLIIGSAIVHQVFIHLITFSNHVIGLLDLEGRPGGANPSPKP